MIEHGDNGELKVNIATGTHAGQTFFIAPSACTEPLCSCTDVRLHFFTVKEDLTTNKPPQLICHVDIKKCKVDFSRTKPKSIEEKKFATEFGSMLSERDWAFLNGWFHSLKAEYTENIDLTRHDVPFETDLIERESRLVGYNIVLPFAKFLSIQINDDIIIIDENYCVASSCNCKDVHFCYFYRKKNHLNKTTINVNEDDAVYLPYNYKTGKWGESEIGRNLKFESRERVEQVKSAFSAKYPDFSERAKKHHHMLRSLYRNFRQNDLTPSTKLVKKVGRNEPCPCGSGNKYKKCCG